MLAAAALDIRGLHRSPGGRHVLAGVDLRVEDGEIVALLGRSGCGKSTLLRIAAGLDRHDGAERLVIPDERGIGFQDPRLLPWKRVRDNVSLGLRGRSRARAAADAERALADVGLAGRADAWPLTLSGGEAQRVSLARAIVRRPRLLLLDEPFSSLDALTRRDMHALLRDLHRRLRPAVLLVTHDVDEALALADRVAVLRDGAIALDASADAVTRDDVLDRLAA